MSAMLTARELQEIINVDRSTIYRMAESGRLPAVKVGRQWRFPAQAIEGWLGHPAGDVGAPDVSAGSLRDLLPSKIAQGVADLAAEVLRAMVVVTDMEGNPLTAVSRPCGFFTTVAASPLALDECIAGWRDMTTDLDLQPHFAPSRLGFLCAHSFIRVERRLAGMIMAGGIAPEEWPPPSSLLAPIGARLGLPEQVLAAAAPDVIYADASQRAAILDQLPRFGHLLSSFANERHELLDRLKSIATLAASPNQGA